MPAPFSPDPADQPPAPSDARTSSNLPNTELQHAADGTTPAAFEPPTVISGMKSRSGSFDPKMGEALTGRKLGHFELIESVGAGGMAAVLKARDLDLGRIVALKILPPDMAADPENIVRFKQEARAAARLDHENVARVYFFGEDQGLHFIAFEFVEGDNLRQMMAAHGGTIAIPDAVALMLQVSAGLAHAAERGLVHRDIKPSNIVVTPDGRAKIVDMGLARNLDPLANGQLTESGVTLGTFDYISPEQAIEPRSADVRSDIYSLGCTFYHALTGHLPVPEGNAAKKLDAQRNIVPPDPRKYNPAIPADLAAILARMMAKNPDRRYQHPDHLSAHLRAVARKLGVAVGPPAHGTIHTDPVKWTRRNVGWLLAGAAAIALLSGALTYLVRPKPDTNVPEARGLPVDPGEPVPPGPGPGVAIAAGPRDAANDEEFVGLLDQGVKHIRLTGTAYDLVKYRRSSDGHAADPVLAGDEVVLEGVNQPTVRMQIVPADGKSRLMSLTLRGTGSGSAVVRGIHFVLTEVDADLGEAGLVVTGFDKVTIEECTFTPPHGSPREIDRASSLGPASLAVVLRGGLAALSHCYFARGSIGLAVDGPGRVTATECAIGPHHAGIRVARPNGDLTGETEVILNHCSALLPLGGSAVEIADQVPCLVRAAFCLFAGPDRSEMDEAPAVVRQRKRRTEATRYDADHEAGPNGYYKVVAYAEGDSTWSFAEAARDHLPIKDIEEPLKHPWVDRDPLALLAGRQPDPRKAFTQNLRLSDLRVKGDKTAILGTRFLGPDPLFATLPPVDGEARDATVKILDTSLRDTAEDLPPGVFATLERALAAVRKGDTLLIRHNGRLEVDPHEFTRADTNLTIKPDANYKPILMPAPVGLKRADGMFKLFGKQQTGRLVLDGLHFRLPAGRAPAVVVLPGGGQLEIRNCVITMEDGDDLSAIVLTDPRNEMMMAGPAEWPVPKVTIENAFIRGKGRLLAVKGSRPFELDVKNTLAALDSTLIDIDPSTADPSTAGSGMIHLSRVTTYLGGSLLHFRGSGKADMNPVGLARTEVTAEHCLFAPAGVSADPLVRAERLDSKEQAEKWFGWRGKDNVYGYDKTKAVLEIRPADPEMAAVLAIDGTGWLALTQEDGASFAEVVLGRRPPEAGQPRRFMSMRPGSIRPVRIEPLRPDGAADIGAPADVPVPFADEQPPKGDDKR